MPAPRPTRGLDESDVLLGLLQRHRQERGRGQDDDGRAHGASTRVVRADPGSTAAARPLWRLPATGQLSARRCRPCRPGPATAGAGSPARLSPPRQRSPWPSRNWAPPPAARHPPGRKNMTTTTRREERGVALAMTAGAPASPRPPRPLQEHRELADEAGRQRDSRKRQREEGEGGGREGLVRPSPRHASMELVSPLSSRISITMPKAPTVSQAVGDQVEHRRRRSFGRHGDDPRQRGQHARWTNRPTCA